MDPLTAFMLGSAFVLGAVVGSFLNVCIHRFPPHVRVTPAWKSLLYPPSHCPRCKAEIRWYNNVPIFGWLWLGGRCRDCRLPIPIRYPGIELLTALLFVAVYLANVPVSLFGPITDVPLFHPWGPLGSFTSGRNEWPGFPGYVVVPTSIWSAQTITHLRFGFHLILIAALIVATFIDYDLMIIPDSVTRPATIAGIVGNTVLGCTYLVPVWYAAPGGLTFKSLWWAMTGSTDGPGWLSPAVWEALVSTEYPAWITSSPHLHGLAVSLSGILVGGFIVWVVRRVGFWALQREAMGDGDIYLLAMIGSFLGWQATIVVFFLAPLCALTVSVLMLPFHRSHEIPYGPYLSAATLLVLFAFPWVWPPFESGIFSLGLFVPVLLLLMGPLLGGMLRVSRILLTRLGFNMDPPLEYGEWTSADTLTYLSMERVDEEAHVWRTRQWPGVSTGRGQAADDQWRRPENGGGWKGQWERRR